MAALLLATGLGGCESVEHFYSSELPVGTAIDWWHHLQGGVIAQERPPPPGADAPYPNLDEIPKRPTIPDVSTRRALLAKLATQRDLATRDAVQDPIVPPKPVVMAPPPSADAPGAAGQATGTTSTPAASPPMSATIEAADAPPAPRPRKAAATPAEPAPIALQQAAAPVAPPRHPDPGDRFVSGPVPPIPAGPPPVPTLSGIPADTFAPPTPRLRPQVEVAFLPGSDILRPDSTAALRGLAERRGGGPVAVLGGGDAQSDNLTAQTEALPLAWRRARAIQGALVADGVPTGAIRVDAAALANGGIARLVE